MALAEEGQFGKAGCILTSSGIADNNDETWNLLNSKHPYVPIPSLPTSVLSQSSIFVLYYFHFQKILLVDLLGYESSIYYMHPKLLCQTHCCLYSRW